ncbi:MAG: hypothetical protein NC452_13205 [Eubacterium sp.]|nr:hypothetical protein [Eubacterium sp.]
MTNKAYEVLEAGRQEAVRSITISTKTGTKNAWYYTYMGELEFAQSMGFITDAERQERVTQFRKDIKFNE